MFSGPGHRPPLWLGVGAAWGCPPLRIAGAARPAPHLYDTPPLPCAESGNLRSSLLLNYEGCMAMVTVAATFDVS